MVSPRPVFFRYASAFWAMYRGSREYHLPVTGSFTLQMSTSVGTAVNGSIAALDASGTSSMSDSSIVWNPRIEEPSKPSPSSKMSSFSSEIGIEKCCQSPGRSMNRRSTILAPFSLASLSTSFAVMRNSFSSVSDGMARLPYGNSPAESSASAWWTRDSVGHAGPRLAERARVPRPDLAVTATDGVRRLGVLREVEPGHLVLFGHPEPDQSVDDFQDDRGPHDREHVRRQDGDDLDPDLARVAEEQPVVAAFVDRLGGEEPRGQRSPGSAHRVHADDVERVIIAELPLEVARRVAHRARDGADDQGRDRADEARGGRDRDEPRDGARRRAQHRGLAAAHPLGEHPAERRGRRARVG